MFQIVLNSGVERTLPNQTLALKMPPMMKWEKKKDEDRNKVFQPIISYYPFRRSQICVLS